MTNLKVNVSYEQFKIDFRLVATYYYYCSFFRKICVLNLDLCVKKKFQISIPCRTLCARETDKNGR